MPAIPMSAVRARLAYDRAIIYVTRGTPNVYLTKRQKEIYEYLKEHIQSMGYAPSIMEICAKFNLSSPATVHKHLSHIEEKGLIRREQNMSRAIELVEETPAALPEFPLLGHIMAGKPIEVIEAREMMSLMPDPSGKDIFVLKVKGQSMIDDHIQDGDYVIVERRDRAEAARPSSPCSTTNRPRSNAFTGSRTTSACNPPMPTWNPSS